MQDMNDKITGNTLTATEFNQLASEIQNVIEALGIALSGTDLNQLGKAIAGYSATGDSYTDSGVADAYVLTPVGGKQGPDSYAQYMTVRFEAGNNNTGGAVTVNVNGLGVKPVKNSEGVDPAAGAISGLTYLIYVSGIFYVINSVMRIVSQTDAEAGTSTLPKAWTAQRVAQAVAAAVKRTTVTVITASNPTWTPQSDTVAIEFTAMGGGGAGGGANNAVGAGYSSCGAGGASGGLTSLFSNLVNTSYNITIGAGGAGVVGAAGGNGSATTVVDNDTGTDINLVASPGGGGPFVQTTGTSRTVGGGSPITGSAPSGGDLNLYGDFGSVGAIINLIPFFTGKGAASALGGGGTPALTNGAGGAAVTFGGGGGGATAAEVVANYAGGAGGNGVVIIKEYRR